MVGTNKFRKIAEKARERRLDGPHHDSTSFPLIGYCFDNAFVLFHLLKEKGYSPQIVAGTTERVAEDLQRNGEDLEENITKVKDLAGLVHYWVLCDGVHIDIASDSHDFLGEILVTNSLPDSYYLYSDSEKYGADVVKDAYSRRCSYCGAQTQNCNHQG